MSGGGMKYKQVPNKTEVYQVIIVVNFMNPQQISVLPVR
jgi:hypothetical protein